MQLDFCNKTILVEIIQRSFLLQTFKAGLLSATRYFLVYPGFVA